MIQIKKLTKFLLRTILIVVCTGFLFTNVVQAQTPDPLHPVDIYLFWGDGCPICEQAKPYFEQLAEKHPEINLQLFEVYYNQENRTLLFEMAEIYGFEVRGVPTFFIGSHYWMGYNEQMNPEIETVINQCLQTGCSVLIKDSLTFTQTIQPTLTITPRAEITPPLPSVTPGQYNSSDSSGKLSSPTTLNVPFLGSIDLDRQSLILSTLLISFVDGFNPCSIWILTMLLAITLHTGSRKKSVSHRFHISHCYGWYLRSLYRWFVHCSNIY